MNRILVTCTAIAMFLLPSVALSQDFVVVGNSALQSASISKDELTKVFTGQTANFGGQTVSIVILDPNSPAAKSFFSVIGTTSGEFESNWLEKALSGAGKPPIRKNSSADVLSTVSGTSGGIGFIAASDKDKIAGTGAKELAVK